MDQLHVTAPPFKAAGPQLHLSIPLHMQFHFVCVPIAFHSHSHSLSSTSATPPLVTRRWPPSCTMLHGLSLAHRIALGFLVSQRRFQADHYRTANRGASSWRLFCRHPCSPQASTMRCRSGGTASCTTHMIALLQLNRCWAFSRWGRGLTAQDWVHTPFLQRLQGSRWASHERVVFNPSKAHSCPLY